MRADRDVRLTRLAKADLRAAVRYYERQRPSLGRRFELAFGDCLERLAAHPESFVVVHRDVRRHVLENFPYGVYFRVKADLVRVIAIHHLHRHPSSWQRRAGE